MEGIGEIYVNKMTLSGDHPARFENGPVGLFDAIALVKTHDVYAGRQGDQTYPIAVDETIGLQRVDLMDLWFKNQNSSNEGVVHIIGTVFKLAKKEG